MSDVTDAQHKGETTMIRVKHSTHYTGSGFVGLYVNPSQSTKRYQADVRRVLVIRDTVYENGKAFDLLDEPTEAEKQTEAYQNVASDFLIPQDQWQDN